MDKTWPVFALGALMAIGRLWTIYRDSSKEREIAIRLQRTLGRMEAGFRYRPDLLQEITDRLKLLHADTGHNSMKVLHLVSAEKSGLRIDLFDFELGAGKSHKVQTGAIVSLNGWQLPSFRLTPCSVAAAVLGMHADDDISLPTLNGSSHRYQVHGNDAAGVQALFAGISLDRILTQTPGLRLAGSNDHLLLFALDARLPAEDWTTLCDQAVMAANTLGTSPKGWGRGPEFPIIDDTDRVSEGDQLS